MPGMMSIGGLVSGIKTDDIIAKIMEYARRPQKKMEAEKALKQAQLAAWQELNTRILALKTRADSIASTSTFLAKSVTSSDTNIVTASANYEAAAGTYEVIIAQRAEAHQVSTEGNYTSINDVIGTGKVTITQNGKSFDIEINSNNNTLAGLRDSINRANKDVQAMIINTGTANNPDYELVLTSKQTGEDYQFTVTYSNWEGGTPPGFTKTLKTGQNAQVKIGSGAEAITIQRQSNTISDIIPGVTLNILSADPTKTIRLDVTKDISAAKSAIQGFVTQYNDLAAKIEEHFKYDVNMGEGGVLFGSFQLQTVQMDLSSIVSGTVSGLSSSMSALASIGITLDTTGRLVINDSNLTNALTNNTEAVAKLFGANLESNSSYVSYVTSTADTKPSGSAGWNVVITQAARQAQVTAGVAMNAPLDADETLTISGVNISLTQNMTLEEVIAKINNYSSQTGVMALATGADGTGTGNYITLRSVQYGVARTFNAISSRSNATGNTTGIGRKIISPELPSGESGTGQGLAGLDVAGTINGIECVGKGQILSAPTNTNSGIKGLSLMITASEPIGPVNVVFTKGVGATLSAAIASMTSSNGIFTQTANSINQEITILDEDLARLEERLQAQQDRIMAQFNAMEAQLAKLQQQGNYLASALGSLNKGK